MQMSFLGTIGHLMAGSGLHEMLDLIYASKAVDHILSGKAIARAVRAHLLVDAALNTLLASKAFNLTAQSHYETYIEDDCDVEILNDNGMEKALEERLPLTDGADCLLKDARLLYEKLMAGSITAEEVSKASVLRIIKDSLYKEREVLQFSRTAKIWLQYMDMVDILRCFIKADRCGNWRLHLKALSDMLPYLAAAGHNNYVKFIHVYLEKMCSLCDDHPNIQEYFDAGFHCVRRSDRFWAGLSTDLVIEQVLMRSIKTSGGLTRGRGMAEQQHLTWLLSMPACAQVNQAMQELTAISFNSGEQNKDMSKSRQERDMKDTFSIYTYLKARIHWIITA